MKIVVIGGTGLIGSKVVAKLKQKGHEAIAAAPNTGVNTITGDGLKEVMAGTQVVIDVANSPSFEDKAVLKFFETSGHNLLAAEAAAGGIRHHVALSIVGDDRTANGYFRAKIAQEKLIEISGIPYTIVRSTQFLEFLRAIAASGADGNVVRISPALFQPIAADDVAAFVADAALATPRNGIIEIAGPERAPFSNASSCTRPTATRTCSSRNSPITSAWSRRRSAAASRTRHHQAAPTDHPSPAHSHLSLAQTCPSAAQTSPSRTQTSRALLYVAGSMEHVAGGDARERARDPAAATRTANSLLDEHRRLTSPSIPRDVARRIGEQIDSLLDDPDIAVDEIREGLTRLRSNRKWGPGMLPNLVHEVRQERAGTGQPRARSPDPRPQAPDNAWMRRTRTHPKGQS